MTGKIRNRREKIRRYTESVQVTPWITQTTVGIHEMEHGKNPY